MTRFIYFSMIANSRGEQSTQMSWIQASCTYAHGAGFFAVCMPYLWSTPLMSSRFFEPRRIRMALRMKQLEVSPVG